MDEFAELLARKRQGSLKIYLGYAAGVGKTFAMLQEAHRLRQEGFDVVIGYVEPHRRPETVALMDGLEALPPRRYRLGEVECTELDTEAVLTRRPQIVLVDELAHTNAHGSVRDKRYQDVLVILEAGISVITTLNVQHL